LKITILIEEMDRQRSQAIKSLEVFDHSVKCQKCGMAVLIVGKLTTAKNDRIAILQKRIKWIENYSRGNTRSDDVKQLWFGFVLMLNILYGHLVNSSMCATPLPLLLDVHY
jgi:hypothetical protein